MSKNKGLSCYEDKDRRRMRRLYDESNRQNKYKSRKGRSDNEDYQD